MRNAGSPYSTPRTGNQLTTTPSDRGKEVARHPTERHWPGEEAGNSGLGTRHHDSPQQYSMVRTVQQPAGAYRQTDGNSQSYNRRMTMRRIPCFLTALALVLMLSATASAADFFFTTGDPDGRLAAASRPESRGKIEIEAADDFILTAPTTINRATFTGLLFHGGHGEIRYVSVEV